MTGPEEYRARLRAWFAAEIGDRDPDTVPPEERVRLARSLYDAGLAFVTWPAAYGGQGLGADFQTVFNEEAARYATAFPPAAVTVGICAATLLDFGTEAQKTRWIPAMLRGDAAWTQLLSEPGAGSDLGSVATRAEPDGDHWVVNGQKVWTSGAREADYALALVRTDLDRPKYEGVSMLVVDLRAPGVDIRPLREMTGEALFNEVFLDGVRVPRDAVVGEVNGGWPVLTRMLHHERMALSAGTTGGRMDRDAFPELVALARAHGRLADAGVRAALAEVYIQTRLLDLLGRRMRAAAQAGRHLGPVGSIGKIATARSARLSAEAGMLIAGLAGQAWEPGDTRAADTARQLLFFPMTGIAGGTTEIQKNIVAERVLGLPREPRPDRDLPFRLSAVDRVG